MLAMVARLVGLAGLDGEDVARLAVERAAQADESFEADGLGTVVL